MFSTEQDKIANLASDSSNDKELGKSSNHNKTSVKL
jgi:hypothetical protein